MSTIEQPIPDHRPFTDSILADIDALPEVARAEIAQTVIDRYATPAALDWASLCAAIALPLCVLYLHRHSTVLLAHAHIHHHFSPYAVGFALGLAAMATADAVLAFAGSIYAAVHIRRRRR